MASDYEVFLAGGLILCTSVIASQSNPLVLVLHYLFSELEQTKKIILPTYSNDIFVPGTQF